MDWLNSLLWDPSSVAHIVLLYSFVIAVGVLLGKIKIAGISLGVTFVLFMGILVGHFGFTWWGISASRCPRPSCTFCVSSV